MTKCKGCWLGSVGGLIVTMLLGVGFRDAAFGACSPAICVGGNPCTISGVVTIDNGCSLDWGPDRDVVIVGTLGTATIGNSYSLKARNLTLSGTLQARGGTLVVRTGQSFTIQVVGTSAAKIDVERGGYLDVAAGGAALLHGKDISADGTTDTLPGSVSITATSVDVTSPIHAIGFSGNDGGEVFFTSTAGIVIDGTITVSGGGTTASGGVVDVDAGADLWVKKPVTANGDDGGIGGDLFFRADGNARIDGDVTARGVGAQAAGGTIGVIAGSTTITGAWKAIGTGGGGGEIDIDSFGATILTNTSSFSTAASAAGDGGDVDVFGADVTIAGTINANTAGQFSASGTVSVGADDHLTLSGAIEGKSSNGGIFDSTVHLSACTVSITSTGSIKTRNTMIGGGLSLIFYGASFTAAAGSSVLADNTADDGGNFVFCRCVDTSPADGVCDTNPATCASAPATTGATITPAMTVKAVPMPACS